MATKIFIGLGVFSIELLACKVSMICAANWPRQLTQMIWYWGECMTSSVISFANIIKGMLNISIVFC